VSAAPLVTYDVTDAIIAETRERCNGLTVDTPVAYEETRQAIASLRDTRVAIEKRRVILKADALAYGRTVDSEAKRLTLLLEAIEDPLKVMKAVVDDEKARVKAEADAAKLRAYEAEIQANLAAQEAERKAKQAEEDARRAEERAALDAERATLAEERRRIDAREAEAKAIADAARKVEQDKLDAERAAFAEVKRLEENRQRTEQEHVEAERRVVEKMRQDAERAEFERQAVARAEAEAVKKAEAEQLAKAQRAADIAALAPDVEKLRAFAASIRAVVAPKPKSKAAKERIADAVTGLELIARGLDESVKEMM